MTRNGGAAVVETLAAHGVDTVFGIPGTHNLELYRWFAATGIRPVTPRHEQGAGYAADAAAWVSGRPGVVVTTSGPGLLNAAAAAATSWAESRPVLLLSPGAPTGTGSRPGQAARDQGRHGRAGADRRVEPPGVLARGGGRRRRRGVLAFATGRPRPVHIEIPLDVLGAPWTGPAPRPRTRRRPTAPADAVRAAADAAARARNPADRGGRRRRRRGGPAAGVAEALGAPVAPPSTARPCSTRPTRCRSARPCGCGPLQSAAAESDAVLVVGSELGDSDLLGRPIAGRDRSSASTSTPAQLRKNAHADLVLHGDAAATLRRCADCCRRGRPPPTRGRPRLRAACRRRRWSTAARAPRSSAAVRAALPAGGILAGDSSQVTYFGAAHLFDQPAPREFCYMPASPPSATACRPRSARRWPRPTGRWPACSATAR